MKFVYIAGLGHSGTTLLNQLLTQGPAVVSLGEVASFFSKAHMTMYMRKWGDRPAIQLCSCGVRWSDCPFWGKIEYLSGMNTQAPLAEKYKILMEHVRLSYGEDAVVVDSSKSLATLDEILEGSGQIGLDRSDIFVIHALRDVRGFVRSSSARSANPPSMISLLRSFNLWLGSNREFSKFLEDKRLDHQRMLYETLCMDPQLAIDSILNRLGLNLVGKLDQLQAVSHIVMGNKNFTVRNRDRIKYDNRWFTDDRVNCAYLLHGAARRFNSNLYENSGI